MTESIKIIGIETSGSTCGVGLFINGSVQSEYSITGRNMHDNLLAEFTRRILIDSEFEITDIDAIAVSAGPGSFTGLRIGASFAKGICFENAPKLIAIPTLDAMAFHVRDYIIDEKISNIAVIIKSHKDLVYFAQYDVQGNNIKEISHLPYSEIILQNSSLLIGDNPIKHNHHLKNFISPRASFLNEISFKLFKEGKFVDASDFEPLYIQEFIPKKSKKELNI